MKGDFLVGGGNGAGFRKQELDLARSALGLDLHVVGADGSPILHHQLRGGEELIAHLAAARRVQPDHRDYVVVLKRIRRYWGFGLGLG